MMVMVAECAGVPEGKIEAQAVEVVVVVFCAANDGIVPLPAPVVTVAV